MKDFDGKVAVITGAGSGIGRGLANRFARVGMRLVLADIEEAALRTTAEELALAGAEVLAVPTDVAKHEAVARLADAAHDRFGKVHVLCNNAGVVMGGGGMARRKGGIWHATSEEWAWLVGVNLMGVVHGLQAFVPRMLAHDEDGHILNTASIAGVTSGDGSIYATLKHAVVRLTEGLHNDLVKVRSRIRASVLLPGMVASRLMTADRNRPESLRELDAETAGTNSKAAKRAEALFQKRGMSPDALSQMVLDAIVNEHFYIFSHPNSRAQVRRRFDAMLDGQRPASS